MQYRLAYIMWNSLLAWKNLSETGMKMSTLVLCTVLPPDHTTPGLHHYTYISFMMSVSLQLKWFSFTTSLHFTQYLVTFYLFTLNIMVHNDFSLIKKGGEGVLSVAQQHVECVFVFCYFYIYKNKWMICMMFHLCFVFLDLCLEYAQLFAALIARTAKDVDVLIDSLPSEESTAALQVSTFISITDYFTCVYMYFNVLILFSQT